MLYMRRKRLSHSNDLKPKERVRIVSWSLSADAKRKSSFHRGFLILTRYFLSMSRPEVGKTVLASAVRVWFACITVAGRGSVMLTGVTVPVSHGSLTMLHWSNASDITKRARLHGIAIRGALTYSPS